jgi:fructose-bisphosphate aldolase, class I
METSVGAWIPIRTLFPRTSSTVTTMVPSITSDSPLFLVRTNIGTSFLLLCLRPAGTPLSVVPRDRQNLYESIAHMGSKSSFTLREPSPFTLDRVMCTVLVFYGTVFALPFPHMTSDSARIQMTIRTILQSGRGILAADESSSTIKKRFDSINTESNEESRRSYRNLLFSADGFEKSISGVILFDETVDQKDDSGQTFSELIAAKGAIPGIKTDEGKEEHPTWTPQTITRGLKGLGKRLEQYTERSRGTLGFTKWRQVILIDPNPSDAFLDYVCNVLAEQSAWSLSRGYVPINEPEILMDGSHSLDDCARVTERTLTNLFKILPTHGVDPSDTILKTNMVLSGKETKKDSPEDVAEATVKVFQSSLPDSLPGIVFLSGGQSATQATENLNACSALAQKKNAPWVVSFSYGRALQEDALTAWAGKEENERSAQDAFVKRARLNALAQKGDYDSSMEKEGCETAVAA